MSEQDTVQEVAEALPEKERKIIVDLWKTKMHGEIIGIKQKEDHMAKSRQFNRDLELFGEVREEKKGEEETIGYLGYRKGLWDDEKEKLNRRLVIKLFSKSMYYQGTIEEMIAREFTRSLTSRRDFPNFYTLIDGHDYILSVSKIRGGLFVPEWFSFRVHFDKDKKFYPVILKHKMGPGIDYRIVHGIGDKEIGLINGKKFDVGGRYDIDIKSSDPNLLSNVVVRTLILFAATLKFHKSIHRKIKKGTKLMKKGIWTPNLINEELLLHRNPRAILRK
ncbi:MAG: hypothetical protein ACW97Z_16135 [Candidatus Hodarchaeales archaeon]|jgi:hypothetical protein